MLEFLLERLVKKFDSSKIILTTSPDPRDQILVEIAEKKGIKSFCGDPVDKLQRYLDASLEFDYEGPVVIVDGDDPFCSPAGIEQVYAAISSGKSAARIVSCPIGMGSAGFSTDALAKVCERKNVKDTEVWGGLFFDSTESNTVDLELAGITSAVLDFRLTVDYEDDLKMVNVLASQLKDPISADDEEIFKTLIANQGIKSINAHCQRLYLENFAKLSSVDLKGGEAS